MKQNRFSICLMSIALVAQAACGSNPPPQTQDDLGAADNSSIVQEDDAEKDETAEPKHKTAKSNGNTDNAATPREQQCNQLIEVINTEQATIRGASTDDAAAMRTLAKKLTGVTENVNAVKVDDSELQVLQQRYIKLIDGFADTARFTADAMDAKDLEKLQEAQVRLKEIGPAESKLVADINQYCLQ